MLERLWAFIACGEQGSPELHRFRGLRSCNVLCVPDTLYIPKPYCKYSGPYIVCPLQGPLTQISSHVGLSGSARFRPWASLSRQVCPDGPPRCFPCGLWSVQLKLLFVRSFGTVCTSCLNRSTLVSFQRLAPFSHLP